MDSNSLERVDQQQKQLANDLDQTTEINRALLLRRSKKRASRACSVCRARKVRCDVTISGRPCTNCSIDRIECALPICKRRNRKAVLEVAQPRPTAQHAYTGIDGVSSTWTDFHIPLSMVTSTACGKISDRNEMTLYPNFFKPLPAHLDQVDINYLLQNDAFSVPQQYLQTELLRCCKEYVYCQYPIFDPDQFKNIQSRDVREENKVSILLFQAVLLSGLQFANIDILRKAGFQTRNHAQAVLFKRVRLLYDFDCEPDPIALIQVLLFMSSTRYCPTDSKTPTHWLKIAISISYRIGLHRKQMISCMTSGQRGLCRRIWWTCVIRDRLIALHERKSVTIKVEDCNVPMLCIEDFGLKNMSSSIRKRDIAAKCIDMTMLCWCVCNYHMDQRSDGTSHLGIGKTQVSDHDQALVILTPSDSSQSMVTTDSRDCASYEEALSIISASRREYDDVISALLTPTKLFGDIDGVGDIHPFDFDEYSPLYEVYGSSECLPLPQEAFPEGYGPDLEV